MNPDRYYTQGPEVPRRWKEIEELTDELERSEDRMTDLENFDGEWDSDQESEYYKLDEKVVGLRKRIEEISYDRR